MYHTIVRRGGRVAVLAGTMVVLSVAAMAEVDLLFAPTFQSAPAGGLVEIDLVARANSGQTEEFATLEAILNWDPAVLDFVGADDSNAGYTFLPDHFLPDPDGINADLTDGDALFIALAPGGQQAPVPPEGLVITTLQFQALAAPNNATVSLLPSFGDEGVTRVMQLDFDNITGDISGTADVAVVVCGSADHENDGDVDLADFARFQRCYAGADVGAGEPCECLFDFEPDTDVDFDDFVTLDPLFTGPAM